MNKMNTSICYVVPYFGHLPASSQLWLLSCKMNPTVDWILLTDDRTPYDYPENVHVHYCTYEEIKARIAAHFDFPVLIDKPWTLCKFKPAYGEIFAQELAGYDFWGHCDMDLVFGDIRHFLTEDILSQYDKIGFQGHSTLYRNTPEVNARYRHIGEGILNFREAFQSESGRCFDEGDMERIYQDLGIPYYHEINFAHLNPCENSFYLGNLAKEDAYKNKRQIIMWKDGKIYRKYVYNGEIHTEEYMYFHTFMRPIKYKITEYTPEGCYVAYPDKFIKIDEKRMTPAFIKRHGKCSAIQYYCRMAWAYRKKLTFKKIVAGIKTKLRGQKQNKK